ncbi:MAG: AsmA family protein [Acidobacteriia bacterium]|nr:AsmA family protein [Terriglobia bacterium]
MRIVKYLGIVVVVLLLAVVAASFLIDANQFRPRLEATLTEALGRPVTVGNLSVKLWSGSVTAENLAIADDPAFSRTPFLQAKSLQLGVEMMPLIFSRDLNVTGLTIDQPSIGLVQSASGDWNFSSLGSKTKPAANAPPPAAADKAPLNLSVKLVKITGGHFSLGQANSKSKPLALENVNIEVRDFTPASAFPFSFSAQVAGGGQLSLEGKAGPISQTDAAMTPVEATLHVAQLDLARTGLVQPSTGIAGLISLDGTANSTGELVHVKGNLKGEKLKLVKTGSPARRTVQLDFDVEHDLKKRTGRVNRSDLHFGAAPASLTGTYDVRGETAALNMVFSGPSMAVEELEQLLPAVDVVLPSGSSLKGGTASAKLAFAGPADRLVTNGSLGLNHTSLTGFDMGNKMKVISSLAGIPTGPNTDIQTLSANVRNDPAGTAIDGLQFIVPTIGQVTGAGTVSAAHALDFKMRVTLHTSGQVLAALGQKGDTSVPFFIAGTSSDPVFRPDVKGMAQEKIQSLTGNSDLGKAAGGLLNLFGKKKQTTPAQK